MNVFFTPTKTSRQPSNAFFVGPSNRAFVNNSARDSSLGRHYQVKASNARRSMLRTTTHNIRKERTN